MSAPEWYSETITPGVRVSFEAGRVVHRERTPWQDLVLIENRPFGRVLLLDGATQVASADEFAYHEMMCHVPLLAHGHVRRVLIIGGGDCGLAEEVLRHRTVGQVTQVEIDAAVVRVARQHLGSVNSAVFDDERLKIVIDDGAKWLAARQEQYDLILVDSTDPVGAGAVLFTEAFYRDARACLAPGGVLVCQLGVPFLQRDTFVSAVHNLALTFPVLSCYLVAVPSYFGGHLAIGWASDGLKPDDASLELLTVRASAARLQTRYYTPEVHLASLALPRYIGEAFEEGSKPLLSRKSSTSTMPAVAVQPPDPEAPPAPASTTTRSRSARGG